MLKIGTTDTELTARLSSATPAIDEGGKVALPCRMLSDIVRALGTEEDVRLETNEKEAALATQSEAGKNRYALRVHPAEDFPELARFPDEGAFTLRAATLSDAISRVAPAASGATDASRPVLTGVLFDFSEEGATLVATDSFSMTLYKGKLEGAPKEGRAIIPAKSLKAVARLCAMGPEQVEVAMTKGHAIFRVGGSLMLAIRLIEGTFPEHTRLIPREQQGGASAFAKEYAAEPGALIDALSRVGLFARQSTGAPVPITLSFSDSPEQSSLDGSASRSISAVSQEVGSGTENIPVEPAEASAKDVPGKSSGGAADGMRIAFNPDFLLRAVKTCRGANDDGADGEDGPEKVLFCLNAPLRPAVIRPRGDSKVLTLIMPMRDTEAAQEARKTRAAPEEYKTDAVANAEENAGAAIEA